MQQPYIFQETSNYVDYLHHPRAQTLDTASIIERRKHYHHKLLQGGRTLLRRKALYNLPKPHNPLKLSITQDGAIAVGEGMALSSQEQNELKNTLLHFVPWKKGPWNILGIPIESEWQCQKRWQRFAAHDQLLDISVSQVIADIGSHSGYELFRLSLTDAKCIIGFEPVAEHYYTFHIIQNLIRSPKLHFELFGYKELRLFPKFFDLIFCLGVLYHHTDPITILRNIHSSLRPGGKAIFDCQGIPGDEDTALMPRNRYAGFKGFWWLPTSSCLLQWIKRAGFQSAELFYKDKLSTDEQRTTPLWAPIPSLAEGLDSKNSQLTKEGFPAPWRFYVCAKK